MSDAPDNLPGKPPPAVPPVRKNESSSPFAWENKSPRTAHLLNLFLPGAGQFYLGRRVFGCLFAVPFLGCLLAMMVIFIQGYSQYLSAAASGRILQGQEIEKLAEAFDFRLLGALLVAGLVLYIGSAVGLWLQLRSMQR